MNNWTTKRKIAIVEADDFMDQWDRNGLNILFYWKAKFPKFKISLFTIPNRTSLEMLYLLGNQDWIEFLVHGWNHESNFECYGWSYEKTKTLMERVAKQGTPSFYERVFKAPGWSITPNHNGYPAGEKDPVFTDATGVYRGLLDSDFYIFDRHYNTPARPESPRIICVDDQPDLVHFHTWNVPSGDINQRNGFQDIEENFGPPWDENTEFFFVSEAIEKGLFKPCSK